MPREIALSRGFVAVVDDEDHEALSQRRWSALVTRWGVYATRSEAGRVVYMHRQIVGAGPGMKVIHRDGDSLNNRRGNLCELPRAIRPSAIRIATKGRARARRKYPLGPCQGDGCDQPGTDRHHVDGDTLNNAPENVQILCRRCHMLADGRIARLIEAARSPKRLTPPRPCVNCRREVKGTRHGRCSRCSQYFDQHGEERPPVVGLLRSMELEAGVNGDLTQETATEAPAA